METPEYLHGMCAEILGIDSQTATHKGLWAVILGLVPFKDGNQWCVLYGKDLQVAEAAGITQAAAKKAIAATFDAILADVKEGEKVGIHGFGTFDLKEVAEKNGRNPQTGKQLIIPAKKTVRFKFSKTAEAAINGK